MTLNKIKKKLIAEDLRIGQLAFKLLEEEHGGSVFSRLVIWLRIRISAIRYSRYLKALDRFTATSKEARKLQKTYGSDQMVLEWLK